MDLLKVTDAKTKQLKRFEGKSGEVIAVVENGRLVVTKYGRRHDFSARGLTLRQNGLPAW